ncbi:hypothetical protein Glove_478g112 [Diversispora epigaea]|uniref:Uncharacterized protein n=1 Tax=Diversispora epigaea TaxID=1348612 RepID=A0A397GQX3_9GLOM|nr:hypothetical protein Glove_478g112 [Diversispora epigaea]
MYNCNIRYFSNRNSYSQYVNRCIKLYDVSTEESNTKVSEVTDMLLDNDDFNRIEERQSVQEIENLPSGSEITDLFEYGDYNADVSVSLEVISNIPEHFEEILSESLQNEDLDVENSDVRSESSRNEDLDVEEFPNESYADLITLVTKYNLNNKTAMQLSNFLISIPIYPFLPFLKISKLAEMHNNKEYFINYQPVIKCIENLLSNPKISQLFVYDNKKLKIENEQSYREQYTRNWWKKAKELIPSVAYILSIILYSDATTTNILDPLFTNDDDDGDDIELKIDNGFFREFSQ